MMLSLGCLLKEKKHKLCDWDYFLKNNQFMEGDFRIKVTNQVDEKSIPQEYVDQSVLQPIF